MGQRSQNHSFVQTDRQSFYSERPYPDRAQSRSEKKESFLTQDEEERRGSWGDKVLKEREERMFYKRGSAHSP